MDQHYNHLGALEIQNLEPHSRPTETESVFGMGTSCSEGTLKLEKHLSSLQLPLHVFSPTALCRPIFLWPLNLFTAFQLA